MHFYHSSLSFSNWEIKLSCLLFNISQHDCRNNMTAVTNVRNEKGFSRQLSYPISEKKNVLILMILLLCTLCKTEITV